MMRTSAAPRLSLTPEQQRIVDCDAPAAIVIAPAGTGKTELLARRVERFLSEPHNGYAHVLAITYTTRAAAALRERLKARLGDLTPRVACDTIHGFANSMLRQHGSHVGLGPGFEVIWNNDDRIDLLETSSNLIGSSDYRELLRDLDLARAKMQSHQDQQHWRSILSNNDAVDFPEMLTKAIDLLQIPAIARLYQRIYGLIIVDEAQNITKQQYTLLAELAGRRDRTPRTMSIMLMGDPKQSIIGFAGAEPSLLDKFTNEFDAEVFTLSKNFRSSSSLASVAQRVASALGGDKPRKVPSLDYPARGVLQIETSTDERTEGDYVAQWVGNLLENGLPPEALAVGEDSHVNPHEIAVLARNSSALRLTADAIRQNGQAIASAHQGDDLMATDLGAVSILLLRRNSPSHRMAATLGLRRLLNAPCLDIRFNGATAEALRANERDYLDTLIRLVDTPTPAGFVSALRDCELPEEASDVLLAGWLADQELIAEAWQEYADVTRPSEVSWQQFVFHLDRSQRSRDLGPGVRLLTVHKAQGREFKAVAVVGMNDGQFPDFRARSKLSRVAELKTFYVAITRAGRALLLTRANSRATRFGTRVTDPSPYLGYLNNTVAVR